MKFSLWTRNGALNSAPVFNAFKQGAIALGHTCEENSYNADVCVIWSVLWHGRMARNKQVYQYFKKLNKPVIVLEVGALKRNELWRVSIENKFFGHETNNTDERWNTLGIPVEPWRAPLDDLKILICCQHNYSQQWFGMPNDNIYLENIITEIRKYSDRPIEIRPHPRLTSNFYKTFKDVTIVKPVKIQNNYDQYNFKEVLKKSWCVVNYNSTPSMISVIKGVPAFVGQNSLTAPIANLDFSNIENPIMPDRQQWLSDIAYSEWTVDEISKGIPLSRIMSKLES
jgi:hypothetical protein